MHFQELKELLMNNPREKWYELASPHIDLIVNEGIFRKSIVDGWEFAFIPEELKVDYKWKFNRLSQEQH